MLQCFHEIFRGRKWPKYVKCFRRLSTYDTTTHGNLSYRLFRQKIRGGLPYYFLFHHLVNCSWPPDGLTDPTRMTPKKKKRGIQLQPCGPASLLSAGLRMGAYAATHLGCIWCVGNRVYAWPRREDLAPCCVRCWLDQPARPLATCA
jgi:hypothetical protein